MTYQRIKDKPIILESDGLFSYRINNGELVFTEKNRGYQAIHS